MIGNLTSLENLDLSFNELSDFSEQYVFVPPENLTNLLLSNNRFANLPWKKIVSMPKLANLDLQNNDFHHFDEQLMKVLNNGTKVKLRGNKKMQL